MTVEQHTLMLFGGIVAVLLVASLVGWLLQRRRRPVARSVSAHYHAS